MAAERRGVNGCPLRVFPPLLARTWDTAHGIWWHASVAPAVWWVTRFLPGAWELER
jgi:hypothetical protein